MRPLTLGGPGRGPLSLLCLGAHADDIEIGCGGTLLRLLEERRGVSVHWVVFSGSAARAQEARRSAAQMLKQARHSTVRVERFRDGFLPFDGPAVKEVFEALKGQVDPDLVFTHYRDDRHQDHRLISDLTWNTFRDHTILEYEIPKFDGDLGIPNLFVPLPDRIRRRKVRHLMSAFPTQSGKRWYSPETFDALMRLRGIECGDGAGYAEAFHVRKLVLAPGPAPR